MRLLLVLVLCAGCGRTGLPSDVDGGGDGGGDAGTVQPQPRPDSGTPDAAVSCVLTTPGSLLTFGPPITLLMQENPKLLDGVMTPAGRVFALLDPNNTRVLLIGPTWQRELIEDTSELSRVHLAFNGTQLALTWQAGQRLMFALFDSQGLLQHQRQLATTTQQDEVVAGFAGGTWVPVWTHGLNSRVDAWATRIYPDGGDQTLSQKVTNQPLQLGFPASGISAIVTDAGIKALVLAESSALAFTDLFPSHLSEAPLEASRGRGALVDRGDAGVTAIYFGGGPNGRRPDLLRVDLSLDGGMTTTTIAKEPSLYSVQDVAAGTCGTRLVVAYTDDTTGAGPCLGNYCYAPLLHVVADRDGGDWRSPETDGGYVRSVTLLRNGGSLDVAWLSVRSDGTAQVTVAPNTVSCCE